MEVNNNSNNMRGGSKYCNAYSKTAHCSKHLTHTDSFNPPTTPVFPFPFYSSRQGAKFSVTGSKSAGSNFSVHEKSPEDLIRECKFPNHSHRLFGFHTVH